MFFATCARLVPANVQLTIEQSFAGLSPEDYAIVQGIKERLPAANSESPQAVLEFVRDAVRAHAAKPIDMLSGPKAYVSAEPFVSTRCRKSISPNWSSADKSGKSNEILWEIS